MGIERYCCARCMLDAPAIEHDFHPRLVKWQDQKTHKMMVGKQWICVDTVSCRKRVAAQLEAKAIKDREERERKRIEGGSDEE